jgi:hypothetical protein
MDAGRVRVAESSMSCSQGIAKAAECDLQAAQELCERRVD